MMISSRSKAVYIKETFLEESYKGGNCASSRKLRKVFVVMVSVHVIACGHGFFFFVFK
jgi:hypothetical protein